MARQRRLRVYYGPEDSRTVALNEANNATKDVKMTLGELATALIEASQSGRAWVDDFADEPITVPSDLHEVIHAYQHYFSRDAA